MATIPLGTKADTLLRLRGHLDTATVPDLIAFTVEAWTQDRAAILARAQNHFHDVTLIVRSSASCEDSHSSSMAGMFLSVANVAASDSAELESAIEKVIESYETPHSGDQVIIQEQLQGIAACGVMFTRDIDTFAPYVVINYDDETGRTDEVTSGRGQKLKTFVAFKGASEHVENPLLRRLMMCAAELEAVTGCDYLDIEFAFTSNHELFLLQARPLATKPAGAPIDQKEFSDYLRKIRKKAKKLSSPHPGMCGTFGMYSVMTDWNPAEMIGVRPRKLALSLYKKLITDGTWAYQRHNYGYRDLRSFPLLVSFMGLPYIDVRVSFNSFIPSTLNDELAQKLADYYMRQLAAAPTNHDKVEFHIVFSCYDLAVASRLKGLLDHGFSDLELDRIKFALLDLTNHVISPSNGLYQLDEDRIRTLEKRFTEIDSSDLPLLDKIYWLLQDCVRYGTLPFAGLARAGFIAMQMLRSIVAAGILSPERSELFMNSLDTVTKRLRNDVRAFYADELSRDEFVRRYGHLRPGTYDIFSPRYADNFEELFPRTSVEAQAELVTFELTAEEEKKLTASIRENGLQTTAPELLDFLRRAIEGREHSKFIFTRSLSRVLMLIEDLGAKWGVAKADIADLDVETLLAMYSSLDPEDAKITLMDDIRRNQRSYEITKLLRLPQLIQTDMDVYRFHMSDVEPNFITQRSVTEIVVADDDLSKLNLAGKIVFIRSADPGYDWLFSRSIGGLVTLYGGANSHMAIRCAELNIPAVIGCGEQNFAAWSGAKFLEIDCMNRRVRVIT